MEHMRNLPMDHIESLSGMIDIRPGRVVSMALTRSEHCQMTLLAFSDGESVSQEQYFGDTMYYVLDGEMPLIIDRAEYLLHAGDCMAVPAGVLHAIGGSRSFKLLQITIQ